MVKLKSEPEPVIVIGEEPIVVKDVHEVIPTQLTLVVAIEESAAGNAAVKYGICPIVGTDEVEMSALFIFVKFVFITARDVESKSDAFMVVIAAPSNFVGPSKKKEVPNMRPIAMATRMYLFISILCFISHCYSYCS